MNRTTRLLLLLSLPYASTVSAQTPSPSSRMIHGRIERDEQRPIQDAQGTPLGTVRVFVVQDLAGRDRYIHGVKP